tara:strand:+ start:505 stop:744 length:240 start_codon:yes stop_codon:yes gene_type:complete
MCFEIIELCCDKLFNKIFELEEFLYDQNLKKKESKSENVISGDNTIINDGIVIDIDEETTLINEEDVIKREIKNNFVLL